MSNDIISDDGIDHHTCNFTQEVLLSNAGYYLGVFCNHCGPVARYSGYYPTEELALADLELFRKVRDWINPSSRG